ncbi:hypothetical protein LEN26_002808 [Aphanomyces euteiches]|nr:hypothetical protein LEN26_002808 [Aphanomyces euteiches]
MQWLLLSCAMATVAAFGRYCQFCGTNNLPSLFSNPEPLAVLGVDARTFLVSPTYPPIMTAELQDDSNLVIFDRDRTPVWSSNTDGSGGSRLIMQNDGNLVLYSQNGVAVWETRTKGEGQGPYCLTLKDDGYLTIWDSDCYWTWRNGQKPTDRKTNAMLVNVSSTFQ